MRSLRLHAPQNMQMHDEPLPQPGPGEVLVRVGSVGVCASDAHWWRDGRIGSTALSGSLVLGHEAAGTVEAVGECVTTVKPGQRVAIEPSRPCMECEFCAEEHYNVCPSVRFFGTPPTDGCFRDFVVWPAELLLPVPDSISMDEAAMLEPLAVGVYAAELAAIKPGETVAIFGSGAIGLSVLQSVKVAGAGMTLVSEPIEARRKLAKKLGADHTCTPEELHEQVQALTNGRGFDVVIECAGQIETVRETSRVARILGRVLIVGIPREDDYSFDASAARRKQLTVTFVRRSNLTAEKSIELVKDGKVDVASYATHVFPLERTNEALELSELKADGVIRAVVRVSE